MAMASTVSTVAKVMVAMVTASMAMATMATTLPPITATRMMAVLRNECDKVIYI